MHVEISSLLRLIRSRLLLLSTASVLCTNRRISQPFWWSAAAAAIFSMRIISSKWMHTVRQMSRHVQKRWQKNLIHLSRCRPRRLRFLSAVFRSKALCPPGIMVSRSKHGGMQEVADAVMAYIAENDLLAAAPGRYCPAFLTMPRKQELMGALNRLRCLKLVQR